MSGNKRSARVGRRLVRLRSVLAIFLLLAVVVGCNQNMTFQLMGNQPKYLPLAPADLFPDGQSARPVVPDTVARGHLQDDVLLYTGKQENKDSTVFPFPVTHQVLLRGQERFNIFCSPCHARTGMGNGLVVQRGFKAPPSLHDDRLRVAPVGHFFDVITNGFGAMP
ncbi:MAG: c-type cytochrome, partial [Acidobacteriota bacterium]